MERQKKAYKAGWLTTPNAYKKTEVEEIGTTTPKKITKVMHVKNIAIWKICQKFKIDDLNFSVLLLVIFHIILLA